MSHDGHVTIDDVIGGGAHQEPILLFGVVLSLVCAVDNVQLVEGAAIARHLGLKSSLDVFSSLDLLFSFLNDGHDPVQVSQLLPSLPEHLGIRSHLRERV